MENMCYYEILEVSKTADGKEIKKAYRKKAMKYHPDKNQGSDEAEENFKYVNEAYQVLSDNQKKSMYDKYGKEGLNNSGGNSSSTSMEDVINEMFGGAFGFGRGTSRQKRKTYKYELEQRIQIEISFKDSIFGCETTEEYKIKRACKPCSGTGAKEGKLSKCSTCGGIGQVIMKQGFMTIQQTCPRCMGTGEGIGVECTSCYGEGFEEIKQKIKIDVPKGVNTGNQMKIKRKGNISPEGSQGDLYVVFSVEEDKNYIRRDNDIYLEVPVFFTKITLGTKVKIQGIYKEIELIIPKNTEDKQQFKFSNEGIKDVNGHGQGDLYIVISVKYPDKITKQQKDLIMKLEETFDIESETETIKNKIKKWF